jgi:hypothetical protein
MSNQEFLPPLQYPVVVRPVASGQYTAEAVGLPEVRATCADRTEAIHRVQLTLCEWIASGQLVQVELLQAKHVPLQFPPVNPNDPDEIAFREELERYRRQDLERTLLEYELEDKKCSNSSSTPTT